MNISGPPDDFAVREMLRRAQIRSVEGSAATGPTKTSSLAQDAHRQLPSTPMPAADERKIIEQRSNGDRRWHDRRQRQIPVLLDTRSSHDRRQRRRRSEDQELGNDTSVSGISVKV